MNIIKYSLLICVFFLTSSTFALEKDNSDCLDCHSDKSTTKLINGKEVSLYVNEKKFTKSVHGDLDCVDCHEDFDEEEIPHKAGKNIARVNCGNCHNEIVSSFAKNIHNRIELNKKEPKPNCISCHGTHSIYYPEKIKNKEKYYCGKCHTNVSYNNNFHSLKVYADAVCGDCHESEDIRSNLKKSVHGKLACSDCHIYESNNFEKHQDNIPSLSIATCSTCHKKEFETHKASIHGISLLEGVEEAANCWNCHGGHNILSSKNPSSPTYCKNIPKTCEKCHGKKDFQKKYKTISFRPVESYEKSVHGELLSKGNNKVANCTSCHGVHNIKNIKQQGSTISPFNVPKTCGKCHAEEEKNYKQSIHWIYAEKGVKLAPVCNDCHSEHSIKNLNENDNRKAIKDLEQQTCVTCHSNKVLAERFGLSGNQPHNYLDSYHGLAAARGDKRVALCSDCHNIHKILPKSNPLSSVNTKNIKQTCQKCHKNATQVFSNSYSHISFTAKGKVIEDVVTNIYFWLIIIVIGGMILHNLLIFIFELVKKRKYLKTIQSIPRFTYNEIIQHILLVVSFVTLAISGFALKYPASIFGASFEYLGITEPIRQNIHRIAAVIMILTGLYHIVYLLSTKRGRIVLYSLFPRYEDLQGVVKNLEYYLGISKQPPAFDKFDYTEKAEYWALIWGTLIMGITGLILWFPTLVGNWAPTWLIKVSQTIHFYEAVLASLAIIVWHWFFVVFHPSHYPMNLTWMDGKMSLQEYSHHHKKYIYNIVLEWVKFKKDKLTYDNLNYDTKSVVEYLKQNNTDIDLVFDELIENNLELKTWIANKGNE